MKVNDKTNSTKFLKNEEEVVMRDYEFEQLEESYGSLLEEVLLEIFNSEEREEDLLEDSIYDLRTIREIEEAERHEAALLNGDCPDVDDLDGLSREARTYFENLKSTYPKEEGQDSSKIITGFVQFNTGTNFDDRGNVVEVWRSFGGKVVCDLSTLEDWSEVIRRVEDLGIEWTKDVRIVFYGKDLEHIVGTRIYKKGENKHLVPLCDKDSRILLAVPDMGGV